MGIINEEVFYGLLLALAGFLLSMILTPFYTHFAYKYQFWKKQKQKTVALYCCYSSEHINFGCDHSARRTSDCRRLGGLD